MLDIRGRTVRGPDIVLDNLVLYFDAANIRSYPGSGTIWTDLSGNGNHGTLTNGPTYDSDNMGSILFDGTNDYIETPLVMNTPAYTPLTYQVVFKNNENTNFNGLIGRGDYQASGVAVAIMFTNRMLIACNGSLESSEPEFNYINNVITMGTFIVDGRNVKVYRNKTLVHSATLTFDVNPNFQTIRIGGDIQGGWQFANKNVYSAKVYTKALSYDEVVQNFNAVGPRYNLDA